jgi:hypothetical protein
MAWAGGMDAKEHLPSKLKDLSSNSSITKNKNKTKYPTIALIWHVGLKRPSINYETHSQQQM